MSSRYVTSPLLERADVLQEMHDISASRQGGNLKLVLETSRDDVLQMLKGTDQFSERNVGAITVFDELIEMFAGARQKLEEMKK